ncbi:predicted protein [Histoplasma capsulatum G186AR]|uniref:Uncharacterized protein n=1 Tax=Ajellomyces capsulatus (strain G186AR / H82 / ATCC MYA-2454 / RMSCC 2432) TaxID=447093 RepID=C0NZE6_AJECG|nr:uncharacterized protein HCBG_08526 [Histoplasma capsulatum G186AR]EEH03194.1 predicted protein [Histoplasma capsulatum G186AR]
MPNGKRPPAQAAVKTILPDECPVGSPNTPFQVGNMGAKRAAGESKIRVLVKKKRSGARNGPKNVRISAKRNLPQAGYPPELSADSTSSLKCGTKQSWRRETGWICWKGRNCQRPQEQLHSLTSNNNIHQEKANN